jgi:hypothetical protein
VSETWSSAFTEQHGLRRLKGSVSRYIFWLKRVEVTELEEIAQWGAS